MKVLIIVAVWKRPEITEVCFMGLRRFIAHAPKGVSADVLVVGSEPEAKQMAATFGFSYIYAPNSPLGAKMNAALFDAKGKDFDYIMQVGSDDLIRSDYWAYVLPMMNAGVKMFGLNRLYVYCSELHRGIIVDTGTVTFGAGRFIHRSLLDACRWKLWTDSRGKGLDLDSEERIWDCTNVAPMQVVNPWLPLLLDIKGADSIHSYEEFKGEAAGAEDMRVLFPELRYMQQDAYLWRVTTIA